MARSSSRAPDRAAEAEVDGVGELDGLLVAADLVDDGDRAEQLLVVGAHLGGDAGQHGGGEVGARAVDEVPPACSVAPLSTASCTWASRLSAALRDTIGEYVVVGVVAGSRGLPVAAARLVRPATKSS